MSTFPFQLDILSRKSPITVSSGEFFHRVAVPMLLKPVSYSQGTRIPSKCLRLVEEQHGNLISIVLKLYHAADGGFSKPIMIKLGSMQGTLEDYKDLGILIDGGIIQNPVIPNNAIQSPLSEPDVDGYRLLTIGQFIRVEKDGVRLAQSKIAPTKYYTFDSLIAGIQGLRERPALIYSERDVPKRESWMSDIDWWGRGISVKLENVSAVISPPSLEIETTNNDVIVNALVKIVGPDSFPVKEMLENGTARFGIRCISEDHKLSESGVTIQKIRNIVTWDLIPYNENDTNYLLGETP